MTETINNCKGSSYNYAPENKHLFIYVSEQTGNVCYFCNTKENK
jgi:hypothetical protein